MGFWQVVVVLTRHWYVTVAAFLIGLGLAAVVYVTVPLQYQSGSVLVITTSLTGRSEETGGTGLALTNPLLNFDTDVTLATAILIEQMNSPQMAESLGAPAGGTTTYVVSDGTTNAEILQSGPLLFVQGTGPTPDAAERITQRVGDTAVRTLEQRQQDLRAPASTYMRINEIAPPSAGQQLTRSPMRAATATAALAFAASLTAALAFERLMLFRRRGRTAVPIVEAAT